MYSDNESEEKVPLTPEKQREAVSLRMLALELESNKRAIARAPPTVSPPIVRKRCVA